ALASEREILRPADRRAVFDVRLAGLSRHWKIANRLRRINVFGYDEWRLFFAFESRAFSSSPKWADGSFASTSPRISVAADIFCAWVACLTRSAARRALSFDRPASSGAIASNSSISFSDSSKRPVLENDLTARSS